MIRHIVFDAANTLIHKPILWEKWLEVLESNNIRIPKSELQFRHKLVTECTDFPDKTNKDFYQVFNKKVLLSLGIIPSENILNQLFDSCSYLPWVPFDDTIILKELNLPISIISNFNTSLRDKVKKLLSDVEFEKIVISEELGCRKPSIEFYQKGIEIIGCKPSEILYIGDSIELDVMPASSLGIHSILIDRDRIYTNNNTLERADSIADIKRYLS